MNEQTDDATKRRQLSRQEYLKRRVEKKINSLEEEIEYKRLVEEEDTSNLERVLSVVKTSSNTLGKNDASDDYELSQMKRMGQSVKKFKPTGRRFNDTNTSGSVPSVRLPIHDHEQEIVQMIRDNQVSIVVAETGSGKTTQLPQMLYKHGLLLSKDDNNDNDSNGDSDTNSTSNSMKRLVCTQPRRVAAVSVAHRVCQELCPNYCNKTLKHSIVGYSVRFEDQCSEMTRLKFVTDGVLLREFVATPDLSDYAVVMIDEAHERTVATDVLLGLLKDLCRYRADLRVVIASATMNAERFSAFFNGAPIYNVPGRLFPVTRHYLTTPEQDYVYAAVQCCLDVCKRWWSLSCMTASHDHQGDEQHNDILVFMTGQEEIELTVRVLREKAMQLEYPLLVLPLYAALPAAQQQQIFAPTPLNCIKVVVSTNIAETSLTVDGIVNVIDTGMVKQTCFNPRTGIQSLQVTAVSRAAAEQRAGRAGRTRPGHCYRLYTESCYLQDMPAETVPEMQRTNLSSVVLFMKSLGVDDILAFDFLDAPPPDLLTRSLADLFRLGALQAKDGELTRVGLQMAELPVDPPLARVLLSAWQSGCGEAVCRIAGMLSTEMTLFYHNNVNNKRDTKADNKGMKRELSSNPFAHARGDHFMLLRVFEEWLANGKQERWCAAVSVNPAALIQADNIQRQLYSILERISVTDRQQIVNDSDDNTDKITKAFMSGYSTNVAVIDRTGLSYTIAGNRTAVLHPSSCLANGKPPKRILFHDLVSTSKDFMRTAMIINDDGY